MKPIVSRSIVFGLGIILSPLSDAQSRYPFKEAFDKLYPYYSTGDNAPLASTPVWFKKWGWNLFSLADQWETTGDKDYAFKFVKNSFLLLALRNGSLSWDAIASDPNDDFHYTGELMAPMARFAYLAISNSALSDAQLPAGLILASIGGLPMTTVGDYGNWLAGQVKTTYDNYYWGHWNPFMNCLAHSFAGDAYELNYQSHYGQIALYLYASGICPNCNVMAAYLSDYFENNLSVYPGNQSMTWFHNPRFVGDNEIADDIYREDVAHGATDILLPLAAHELYGEGYYSNTQMAQFAKTFTKNIWDSEDGVFRNNVFGTNYDMSDDQYLCGSTIPVNGSSNYYAPGEVLAWMGLQAFDETDGPNDIYTVLTTQAEKLLNNDGTANLPSEYCNAEIIDQLSGQQSYYGLAEVVKAQWARECFDLTLYNREVAYDQDFAAKGILTVDANDGPGPSFADPVITDPIFHIGLGKQVELRAGEAVDLKPGFEADAGSEVEVAIDPLGCEMQVRSIISSSSSSPTAASQALMPMSLEHRAVLKNDGAILFGSSLQVFPNPSSGRFTLVVDPSAEVRCVMRIHDCSGKTVMVHEFKGDQVEVNMTGYAPGVYSVEVETSDMVIMRRVVLL